MARVHEAFHPSIHAYAMWLSKEDAGAARQWCIRCDSPVVSEHEGAIAEAVVYDYLAVQIEEIHRGEVKGKGGPDFRCINGGHEFFVEATNISTPVVETMTGLVDGTHGPRAYSPLTRAINREAQGKAAQFKESNLDAPLVVFVTTLQFTASAVCVRQHHLEHLLIGTPSIQWNIDLRTGEAIDDPRSVADFDSALFVKKGRLIGAGPEYFRRHLSAVVVGGFGVAPPRPPVLGVLHPNPLRPFSKAAMSWVPFAHLSPWPPTGDTCVKWSDEKADAMPAPRRIVLPGEIDYSDMKDGA